MSARRSAETAMFWGTTSVTMGTISLETAVISSAESSLAGTVLEEALALSE